MRLDEYQRHHRKLQRADARRRGTQPLHPIILAVTQFLIEVLNPYPIRRRLYPIHNWACLNSYQRSHRH